MRMKGVILMLSLAMLSPGARAQAPATGAQTSPTSTQAAAPMPSCPEVASAMTRLLANDGRMRDWANLARYRDVNRTLSPVADRVVFMGDSITDSWPNPRFGEFFPGKPYVGRGISGQTTPQMLLRFRQDVIDLKPKAVVILAGTNDIAGNTGPMTNEEIQGYLTSMAEVAKANGIRVVLSSVLPVSNYHAGNNTPQTTLRPMDRIRSLNDWMKKYAAAERHVYLDYFSAMTDDKGLLRTELSGDDLHPNAAGYAIMAPLAEAAIRQALK